MHTTRYRLDGHDVLTHRLSVPLVHGGSTTGPRPPGDGALPERLTVFAREVVRDGRADRPHLLFLQGGPGGRADRPARLDGWLDRALEEFRVVLLDQRGTGASTPADALTVPAVGDAGAQVAYLRHLRADAIVADAEALRREVTGGRPWAVLGQSFGGFVATHYLSAAPAGLSEVLITGGLPGLTASAAEVYRRTYARTAARNEAYLARYPQDGRTLREVARHLTDTEEHLPTGERLSARRLRQVGISLGADLGFDALHYLLEEPFVTVHGTRRLSRAFLAEAGARLSLATNPLYAVLHESIYAQEQATCWAAHRVRREFPGFAEDADPADTSVPYYLTGEHIYPWQLREDPALAPLADAADRLAATADLPRLYDPTALAANTVPVAAAVYLDDMYVPAELSLATARAVGNLRPWVTDTHQHDGLRWDGAAVLDRLLTLARR